MFRIESVYTSRLRNNAHFQFFAEFIDLVNKIGAEALKIKPLFDKLVPFFNKADAALKKIAKSATTKHIKDADKARDKAWNGMVLVVKGYLKHSNPAIRESARKIKIIIDSYGAIDRKNYKEQTSATYNVVQDFTTKCPADVAAIPGLSDWVADLQNLNSVFIDLMNNRNDEEAAKCNFELKEIRTSMDEIYSACRDFINASVLLDGAECYETFIRTWNVNVAKYAVILKRKRLAGSDSPNPDVLEGEDEQPELE